MIESSTIRRELWQPTPLNWRKASQKPLAQPLRGASQTALRKRRSSLAISAQEGNGLVTFPLLQSREGRPAGAWGVKKQSEDRGNDEEESSTSEGPPLEGSGGPLTQGGNYLGDGQICTALV